ncbi:3'-5' exoribonuclease [Radiobacillus kanasensis]|uniref:exonuclease domain-containing protein n=1 Tax=Radiobacillus kanasensis TaxID=2844358 RepID=UPI001E2A6717|nr:exonuclease domain-containing protein [Radiobacillus kanasensis]UFT99659.1 3'-5' exoribonuclease [Radiobacillus kanasensis]
MVMNQMMQFVKQLSSRGSLNQTDPNQIAYMRQLQRELKAKDVLHIPFDQLPVVVFDIETTGFYPDKGDSILSIGAVRMKGEGVLEEETFYSPIYHEDGPSEDIQKLTGLTAEELRSASPIHKVLKEFFHFVKSDTLVAHHSSHEKRFMKHVAWSVLKTSFQHRLIDTSFLMKVIDPQSNLHTLDECCEHYGIKIDQRHHALHDAKATAHLWGRCLQLTRERGFSDLKEVYTHIAQLK